MTDFDDPKPVRTTINLSPEGQSALRALQAFYPGRDTTRLMNRALEVWALVEAELTVDGFITYKDREGELVRLRIFP